MSQSSDPDSSTPPATVGLVGQIPGFKSLPSRRPTNDPLDPETTTVGAIPHPSTSPRSEDPAETDGDGANGELLGELPGPSSTTDRSIGPRQVVTGSPRAFRGVFETLIRLIGRILNNRVAPETPLWLAEDQDVDAIASPLSRIAARHTRFASDEQANDILDGVEAAVGGAGYVLKNQDRTRAYRRWLANGAGSTLETEDNPQ